MNRVRLQNGDRLLAAVQRTEHSLYIYIIKTVIEILRKIDPGCKRIAHHKIFQIRLIERTID